MRALERAPRPPSRARCVGRALRGRARGAQARAIARRVGNRGENVRREDDARAPAVVPVAARERARVGLPTLRAAMFVDVHAHEATGPRAARQPFICLSFAIAPSTFFAPEVRVPVE
jgi:hypothetical protein